MIILILFLVVAALAIVRFLLKQENKPYEEINSIENISHRKSSNLTINQLYCKPTPSEVNETEVRRSVVTIKDLEFENSVNKIPNIMVFDTETTGLPPKGGCTRNNHKNFPRIVQIAWMVFDGEMKVIKKQSYIIKQTALIPKDSIEIHGITDEIAQSDGVNAITALGEFILDIKNSKVLVAHNMSFDYNVVKSELYRHDIDTYSLDNIERYCTMLHSTDFCKIPKYNSNEYKWPTLQELYSACFPDKILTDEMLHDALTDVAVCAKCLIKLHE